MAIVTFVVGLILGAILGFLVSEVLAADDDQRRWR